MPIWAEEELDRLSKNFDIATLTDDDIELLRVELTKLGLDDYFAETLSKMAAPR
ncbi:hypothetical protein D3C87_2162140 [compost metagenome]